MPHILTNVYGVIDPLFGRDPRPVELDLGCGKGRLTLELAARFPERLVLGSDVMLGRLRRIQAKIDKRGIRNIELLRATHQELVGLQLPDACIARVHLLCPDPWPKNRHRAKRTVTTDFLTCVARVLKPGGVLHMSTDHGPYLGTLRATVEDLPFFERADSAIADIADVRTEFEQKWVAEGKAVPHLAYRLVP